MNDAVKTFEDNRWHTHTTVLGFRHTAALEMIGEGTLLDLGCGDGALLSHVKKNNLENRGLDISPEAVKKCAAQGISADVYDFSTQALPFRDNSFEYVVLLDVLEHVYDPKKLLTEARRVSRKFLILSVPNFNSLPARIQVFLGHTPENNRPHKGHIYWFNYSLLQNMLESCNLKTVSTKTNTFYEQIPIVGSIVRFLCGVFPSVFALSFVIKVEKR